MDKNLKITALMKIKLQKWKDAIKINFSKKYPDISGKGRFEVVAEIAASSVLSAYTYWMEHPDP